MIALFFRFVYLATIVRHGRGEMVAGCGYCGVGLLGGGVFCEGGVDMGLCETPLDNNLFDYA